MHTGMEYSYQNGICILEWGMHTGMEIITSHVVEMITPCKTVCVVNGHELEKNDRMTCMHRACINSVNSSESCKVLLCLMWAWSHAQRKLI